MGQFIADLSKVPGVKSLTESAGEGYVRNSSNDGWINAPLARTDQANTFAGNQTFNSEVDASAGSINAGLSAGSILFSDGTKLTEDNSNLYWDDTNDRLGLGTTTPEEKLHVLQTTDNTAALFEIDTTDGSLSVIKANVKDSGSLIQGFEKGSFRARWDYNFNSNEMLFGTAKANGDPETRLFIKGEKDATEVGVGKSPVPDKTLAVESTIDIGNSGGPNILSFTDEIDSDFFYLLHVRGEDLLRFNSNTNTGILSVHKDARVGVSNANPSGKVHITGDDSSESTSIIQAASSQTANITEWQDSGGAVLSGIDENGYRFTRRNSAPSDASIATSEAKFWFDDTNGSPSFEIKAKQADGTVVTGAVSLT